MHRRMKFCLICSERSNPNYENPKEVDIRKNIFEHSDGIVFQTERAKLFYSESIQKKGVVIHNAVGNLEAYDVPFFDTREKKIVSIGRLSHEKGYDILLQAFAKLHSQFPEYVLHIYGTGSQETEYKNIAKELGIDDFVIFEGLSRHALKESWNASCFVLASRYEGMPNALMEALAAGIPCVSTDCPNGPSELITDGENGLLVPVEDISELALAMERMISDSDFARACGLKGRQILDTHRIEEISERYYEFIKSVWR